MYKISIIPIMILIVEMIPVTAKTKHLLGTTGMNIFITISEETL